MALESVYQSGLRRYIEKELFPGAYTLKNDARYMPGIPDLLVLHGDRWAALEVKRKRPSPSDFEPNQEFYIDELNRMSFSSVIYPENEDEVLRELQQAFASRRRSFIPKR